MREKRACASLATWFVVTASLTLAVTGVAKIWSSFGSAKILSQVDPIVGIKFGKLMLMVGLIEIAIALICFLRKRQTLALGLVAWTSTNFVVYRVCLWWIGWEKPCSCLGSLTDALHISPQVADTAMKVVLALFSGSYGLLIWSRWRESREVTGVG